MKKKRNTTSRVLVPVNEKEFDTLVDKIMLLFGFISREHVIAVVANRIMHMPPDQDVTTLEYLGACVRKNIAYQLAEQVGKNNTHKIQIEDLTAMLKQDRGNLQAADALQKHANQGSPFAKAALESLGIEQLPPQITETKEPTQAPPDETLQ